MMISVQCSKLKDMRHFALTVSVEVLLGKHNLKTIYLKRQNCFPLIMMTYKIFLLTIN